MATYPFPYPSAATYPPPIFPGGYCTAPLPFFSSATPAFPYAAAYPYPPPAPASASPTGFYPAQPYGPSTVPYATTSSCPTSEATPIPTNVEPNWPSPAPDPTPPILSKPPLARNPSTLNQSTPSMATSPIYTSACAPVTSAEGSSATAVDLWFNLVDTKPQQHSQVSNMATNQQYSLASAPVLLELAEAQARAEAAISNNMPRAVLDLKHRMDEHHAQFQRSLASLQGQLSKLRDRLSSLTTSSVALSASSSSPFGASFVASTPKFASLSATKSSTKPSAAAYVAPQVFEEMQTPSSSQGTHDSAPDYRSGHHTPIQGTILRDGNGNLREQNFEGMPEAYGLHNLICRTMVRADGTEHSYYALPGNYPLEQAMPEPLFSNESVGVFASNPGQQPYEEAQKEGEPLLRCLSKVLETEHTSACLNITSNVCDLSFELQQQDEERVYSSPVIKASNSSTTRSSQLNIEHSMRELRLLWDPGALLPLMSSTTQHYSPALQPASDATAQGRRDATAVYKVLILQLPMSANSHVWDPGVKIFLCSWLIILQEWSATDTQFPCTHITSVAAHAADVTPVLGFKANHTAGSGSRLIPMCSMKLPMNVQEASHVLKQMPVYGLYEEDTSCLNCMEKQLARRFHKASDNAFSEQLRDPQLKVLVIIERRKEWDPGDIGGVLYTSILTEETSNHLTKCNSLKYLLQSAEIRYPRILSYFFILRYCSVKCNSGLDTAQYMCDQVEGLNPLSLTTPWDPGVLSIINMILDKYTVAHQVQFIQRTTKPSFLSLTYCMQYIAPSGINPVSHATGLIMQRAAHLFPGNYLCSLYCDSVLKTEYYQMRCLWKFSIRLATILQWDPGDTKLHVLFTTAAGAKKLQCIDVYKSTMVPKLAVKLGARRATIFESAIVCSYDLGLGWTEVNASALFVLAVPCSTCTFVAMHFLFLSNGDNSRTSHPKLFMQSLCATTALQVTQQIHPLQFLLMDKVLQNMSDFSDGQLAYMTRSPTINSSEFLRHMFTVLSRWLSSFENRVKLQWDPGIAFVYEQGVQKNYNAKNLLSSPNYLQILELDIIFSTFLPP